VDSVQSTHVHNTGTDMQDEADTHMVLTRCTVLWW